jgi:hypothetical protein
MEEKIKSLRLTATRLALFERKLGTPLTKLTDNDLGFNSMVCLLEAAGMTDDEIDKACDEMGIEKFTEASMEVLLNSGLFKQAKQARDQAKATAKANK